MNDKIKSKEFKQVESFTVGNWNERQLQYIEDLGYVPVIDGKAITYHPEHNEYVVWDEGSVYLAKTKYKWYAYSMFLEYSIKLL